MKRQPLIKGESKEVSELFPAKFSGSNVPTTSAISWRPALFAMGDGVLLIIIGAVSVLAMHLVNRLDWDFALTMVVGMAAAMAVQTVLSLMAAPILGPIESMVPAMIVAMLASMAVCALELFGVMLSLRESLILGASFGLFMFLLMKLYQLHCRQWLRQLFAGTGIF